MKPPAFHYFAPHSVEEALTLLSAHVGEGRILAGGQSLVPLMNMRLVHPGALIDINAIDELAYVRTEDGHLTLGAMTRDAFVEHDATVAAHQPLLTEAMQYVGHPAIRNRSTVGGCLAHADPAAELPAIMLV